MVTLFHWTDTGMLLLFIIVALVIPGLVMYFDDDRMHHLH